MTQLTNELLKLLEGAVTETEAKVVTEVEVLEEDKGNLKDIPDGWMKIVAKSYGAKAGQNSEIKELAQCKNVSRFRDGIINGMKENGLQAIFVTLNDGPFALIYKKDNFSSKAEYSIVMVDGEAIKTQKARTMRVSRTVKSDYSKKGYYTTYDKKTHWFEQDGMPMSTLLPKLQGALTDATMEEGEDRVKAYDGVFKKAKVDIYGITIDPERIKTKGERQANRPLSRTDREGIRADLNAADKKYLKKKADEVGKVLQDDVLKSLEGITTKITSLMDEAAEGKRLSSLNLTAELKEIQAKVQKIEELAAAISSCVKRDGTVELVQRWNMAPKKSFDFDWLIKTFKKAQDEAK